MADKEKAKDLIYTNFYVSTDYGTKKAMTFEYEKEKS